MRVQRYRPGSEGDRRQRDLHRVQLGQMSPERLLSVWQHGVLLTEAEARAVIDYMDRTGQKGKRPATGQRIALEERSA